MQTRNHNINLLTAAVFLLAALLTAPLPTAAQSTTAGSPPVFDEETEKVNKAYQKFLSFLDNDSFEYKREGRHDPFVPFFPFEVVETRPDRDTREVQEEVLTGLRKYEPGQLNLVTIMFIQNHALAMVEDSAGRGYVIRKGTKIGRNGFVDDIFPNIVVIKQLAYYTKDREKRFKTYEMVLKKEGEM